MNIMLLCIALIACFVWRCETIYTIPNYSYRTTHIFRNGVQLISANDSALNVEDNTSDESATSRYCDHERRRGADDCFTRSLMFGNCDLAWPRCLEEVDTFCR